MKIVIVGCGRVGASAAEVWDRAGHEVVILDIVTRAFERLLRGRTTTFQALNFEQDYASAQLLRLRTQAEVLQLTAQLNAFRSNP
mgnify:CR=1 FL=1